MRYYKNIEDEISTDEALNMTYNGQHYVCTSDGNVYAPNVYGWEEA